MPQGQCQCQSGTHGHERVIARMRSLTRMIRCATTATTRQTISSQCFHPENEISVGWRKSPRPGSIAKTNSGPRGARWGRLAANGPSDVGTDAKPKPQILVEPLSPFSESIHHR